MKSCFTAVVGRPSVGKSTLVNALCGEKVSIVSSIPQTTRNKIRGILHTELGQIVFLDTPGYHQSERKINQLMMGHLRSSLEDGDLVLYVLDMTRPLGEDEAQLLEVLRLVDKPLVIALNKADALDSDKRREARKDLEAHWAGKLQPLRVLEISAQKGDGLKELTATLFSEAPEGDAYYPEDYYTDQSPEFRIAEAIREQALALVREEIPHALFVEVEDRELRKEGRELWIRAVLFVERESQKGIVVGKGGAGVKAIRQGAQAALGKIFAQKIQLDLRVKVREKWRSQDRILRRVLGDQTSSGDEETEGPVVF